MFQLKQLNTICHCWSKYIFLSLYYCHYHDRVKLCHYEALDQFGTCSLYFQFITVGAWWPCTYVASRGGVEGDCMHMVWSMLQPHACMAANAINKYSHVSKLCVFVCIHTKYSYFILNSTHNDIFSLLLNLLRDMETVNLHGESAFHMTACYV